MSHFDSMPLWDEFFRDPSIFWDNRHDKKSLRSPDFRHKESGRPLWINGWHNPPCIREKLIELNFLDSSGNVVDDALPKVHSLDQGMVVNIIKSSGNDKNIQKTRKIHADILARGMIVKDAYVATALITSYAKCGAMEEAREVFNQLPEQNVVAWSALISGYTRNGLAYEALICFRKMKDTGVCPNAVTYVCALKACGIVGSTDVGLEIDGEIRKQGLLEENVVLGTALLDMYCKCGDLEKARQVFEQLPKQNLVSWNALIAGYTHNDLGFEALECFKKMKNSGVDPDVVTYTLSLKACSSMGSLQIGEDIDRVVRKLGLLQKDVVLGNALVDMYSKCGALEKARAVFEELPEQNVASWNALIAGYTQNGSNEEALKCYDEMQIAGVHMDAVTYICILKACGILGASSTVDDIDARVRKQGLLTQNVALGTALMDVYFKCGAVEKAKELFDQLPEHNVVTWSTLISGYAQNGFGGEAVECFKQMKDAGIEPTLITYVCILKVCSILGSLETGIDIDVEVRKKGLLQSDIMLGTALVDMYSKCGAVEKAQEVFEKLPEKNVVSWNAMIAGYIQNGFGDEALKCYKLMQNTSIYPDEVTFICILNACSMVGCLEIGEDVAAKVRKQGLLRKNVAVGNALVDMYSKCGAVTQAEDIFQELPVRDVVTWTALIAGYIENELGNDALNCFRKMKDAGVCPNAITYMYILKACGLVGSLEIGEDIHAEVREQGLLQKHNGLGRALLDMYSKCGAVKKAQEIFEQLPEHDVTSWNTLIDGYARSGRGNEALDLYHRMRTAGVMPNMVTFIGLLSACSHAGLVKDGERLFDEMCIVYHFTPTLEHYICMIDLFGRAGYFDKLKFVLDKMPHSGHPRVYRSILGACRKWRRLELGRWAFEQSVQLDENCGSAYVCMGDIYAAAGMQREADLVEALRLKNKAEYRWWRG